MPVMNTFLSPFIETLRSLRDEGCILSISNNLLAIDTVKHLHWYTSIQGTPPFTSDTIYSHNLCILSIEQKGHL